MSSVSPPSVRLAIASTWDGQPCEENERCEVIAAQVPGHLEIRLDAPLHGDPLPSAPPGELEGLWNWEVVELFLFAQEPGTGPIDYTEIEVGPFGHWLCLRLNGIRRRVASFAPSLLEVRRAEGRWSALLRVDQRHLPPTPWRVNAFAAHGPAAERRLLAAFPTLGNEPDFHRPDAATPWARATQTAPGFPERVQSP